MSKEKMPVLAGVIPTFKHFMTAWETLSEKNPHLAVAINLLVRAIVQNMWHVRVPILFNFPAVCEFVSAMAKT
jgi:hypothetical protein